MSFLVLLDMCLESNPQFTIDELIDFSQTMNQDYLLGCVFSILGRLLWQSLQKRTSVQSDKKGRPAKREALRKKLKLIINSASDIKIPNIANKLKTASKLALHVFMRANDPQLK